jgi:hypothetical protein
MHLLSRRVPRQSLSTAAGSCLLAVSSGGRGETALCWVQVAAQLHTHSLQSDTAVRHFIDPAVCTAALPQRRAFVVTGLDTGDATGMWPPTGCWEQSHGTL